jgi:predicted nucleic acid-binding protein
MALQKIVIDTNILISAILSSKGASFKLLSLIGTQRFKHDLSVPLMIEYEDKEYLEMRAARSSEKNEQTISHSGHALRSLLQPDRENSFRN